MKKPAPETSSSRVRHNAWSCTVLFAAGLAFAISALAQKSSANSAPPTPVAADEKLVESDPLRCWLKSTKTSVHVGEQFNVALTCAVIETPRVTVIPDVSQIEPASVQLAPFEVLSGVRHPDIRDGVWRYFQYEYTVRLIADGFFGQDLAVPPISLSYRVSMAGAGAVQEGREKTYVLPQLPIRIVSLVPVIDNDIRDSARDTFADIDARNFRGTVAFVIAGVLYAVAAVMLLIALVRALARLRRRAPAAQRTLRPGPLLAASLRSLDRVQVASAGAGWTPERVGRVLAVLRVAGAIALDKPVGQVRATHDTVLDDGQLLVSRGWFKPGALVVSASTTPQSLLSAAQALTSQPGRKQLCTEIANDLKVFSEARYARATSTADLDGALARARTSLRRLRLYTAWPMRAANQWRRWLRSHRGPRWAH